MDSNKGHNVDVLHSSGRFQVDEISVQSYQQKCYMILTSIWIRFRFIQYVQQPLNKTETHIQIPGDASMWWDNCKYGRCPKRLGDFVTPPEMGDTIDPADTSFANAVK